MGINPLPISNNRVLLRANSVIPQGQRSQRFHQCWHAVSLCFTSVQAKTAAAAAAEGRRGRRQSPAPSRGHRAASLMNSFACTAQDALSRHFVATDRESKLHKSLTLIVSDLFILSLGIREQFPTLLFLLSLVVLDGSEHGPSKSLRDG